MSGENPPATAARRVVLVDTRHDRRDLMRHVVAGDDAVAIVVAEADSAAGAVAAVADEHADAVVLDVRMPVELGLATISALRARYPQLAIVVCSFDVDDALVQRVLGEGADSCLAKPVNRGDIHAALNRQRREEASTGDPPPPAGPLGAAGTSVRYSGVG